ncbi:Ubiquitin domain-containing protein DSK2a [Phytophthora citrophthora]|uniref:Ubiquitin domain-containing protein DSK2a n=1 Tax=Phytophthora citrophthora TaxID=4793 RepID=A0AAD9H2K7_9STRA|nr:Ubiquitin domain-containing protein DSK2a [Phytophthora citrophthora]
MTTPPPAVPEPVAEPPATAEGARLSLKVRTLDQKTYPITICAAASVPQLKELVAVETGITLARQRLIYRGRVLKNDQTLAAYSLEDGHVLHLVARAAPDVDTAGQAPAPTSASDPNARRDGPPAVSRAPAPYQLTTAEVNTMNQIDAMNARIDEFQRSTLRSRSRSRQRRGLHSPPPPPRDNDEPDPTMGRPGGGLPSRLLMGATIAVPEGADVTMPFLSSMIANLVNQVGENGAEGEGSATADGRRHVTFMSGARDGGAAEMESATARALRHHRNREGSGSGGRQRHGRRSSSSSAERQAALRSRARLQLESARATLDDASLNFPAELAALPQGDANAAMTEYQQQVELLLTLVERFGPRLRQLPAALAQRDRMGGANAANPVSTPATASTGPTESTSAPSEPTGSWDWNTRPIESTSTPEEPTPPPTELIPTAVEVISTPFLPSAAPTEASTQTTEAAEATTDSPPNANSAATATEPEISTRHVIRAIEVLQTIGESTELLARMARHAFVRQSMQLGEPIPRRASSSGGDRLQATLEALTRSGHTARRSSGSNRSRFRVARISAADLLGERNPAAPRPAGELGSTPNLPVDLTGTTPPPAVGSETSSRTTQPPAENRQTETTPNDGAAPLPPAGAHISISGMGLPLMSSVVFPFSLAAGLGGSHATTTWNLADFVSRLTSELPISSLYGVMAGDATHLHHVLAHIGFALFSGVDVPRVTRPSIRTWSQDLVGELRRLLRSHALPADVLDQVTGPNERRSALGNELLRVLEPFVSELVDFLVRATSASRAAAFGTSSATFLRTMTQQIARQLRVYARGDSTESEDDSDERLKRLLRGLLVWLGMNENMACFVVDSLVCWAEGDNSSIHRGRTRQREENSSSDSPAIKRQRE